MKAEEGEREHRVGRMTAYLEAEAQALRKVQPDHGDVSPGGSVEERGTP